MIYEYECPKCGAHRRLTNVPEIHADLAAPWCWEHDPGMQMVRISV